MLQIHRENAESLLRYEVIRTIFHGSQFNILTDQKLKTNFIEEKKTVQRFEGTNFKSKIIHQRNKRY